MQNYDMWYLYGYSVVLRVTLLFYASSSSDYEHKITMFANKL